MPSIFKTILFILLLTFFSFIRLYKISSSFFFFNDWGRDMLVLQKWQQTSIPPLLGPLTSAIPFNQSAFYFYLLYPGYLISNGHPISNVYSLIIFYIFIFTFLLFYLKKHNPKSIFSLLVTIFLVSIHPQYIIQNRFIWNPSFVGPLIILSFSSYQLLTKKFSPLHLIIFSASLSLSISLSYSVAPLFIGYLIHYLLTNRQHFKKYFLYIFGFLLFFNLPTLLFEIRHHFFLTNQIFTQSAANQGTISILNRLSDISSYLFLNKYLFLAIIIFSFFNRKHLSFFLLFFVSIISLLLPIKFHYQYIFPILTLLFLSISFSSKKIVYLSLILFLYIFIKQLPSILTPPQRTYQQMSNCYQNFCQQFTKPAFVSTQANFHTFHNGPEHRYLLKKSGCQIKDIETENGQAQYMIVIEDGSLLTPDINFYELDLFGKYKIVDTFSCFSNLSVKLLKVDPPTNN